MVLLFRTSKNQFRKVGVKQMNSSKNENRKVRFKNIPQLTKERSTNAPHHATGVRVHTSALATQNSYLSFVLRVSSCCCRHKTAQHCIAAFSSTWSLPDCSRMQLCCTTTNRAVRQPRMTSSQTPVAQHLDITNNASTANIW